MINLERKKEGDSEKYRFRMREEILQEQGQLMWLYETGGSLKKMCINW